MPTDDFNAEQPKGPRYYLILDPNKDARDGHNIAILHDGRRIAYTDMPTEDQYYALDDDDPLIGLKIQASVFESDIADYDLSNRTDLSNDPDLRRRIFDLTEATKTQFPKPPKK